MGKSTARPTTIEAADGGEVILKNCSKETIEAVREFISGKPQIVIPEGTDIAEGKPTIAEAPKSDAPMQCTALGIYQNPLTLNWHLCTLKFSPYSKEGRVDSDQPVSKDRYERDEKFKIAAVHQGLIG